MLLVRDIVIRSNVIYDLVGPLIWYAILPFIFAESCLLLNHPLNTIWVVKFQKSGIKQFCFFKFYRHVISQWHTVWLRCWCCYRVATRILIRSSVRRSWWTVCYNTTIIQRRIYVRLTESHCSYWFKPISRTALYINSIFNKILCLLFFPFLPFCTSSTDSDLCDTFELYKFFWLILSNVL